MKALPFDIALAYDENLPSDLADEFVESVAVEGLALRVDQAPTMGFRAGIEWMLPTA